MPNSSERRMPPLDSANTAVKIEVIGDLLARRSGCPEPATESEGALFYLCFRAGLELRIGATDLGLPDVPMLGFCEDFLQALRDLQLQGSALFQWFAGE